MASKIKCPSCGAKNDVAAHRCRICTGVINPGAEPAAETPEPVAPVGVDHFDAGDIARQIRPARERFTSGTGALAARLAAAGGSPAPAPPGQGPTEVWPETPPPADVGAGAAAPDGPPPDFARPLPPRAASPSAPIEYESEPFDPDALFRDMS